MKNKITGFIAFLLAAAALFFLYDNGYLSIFGLTRSSGTPSQAVSQSADSVTAAKASQTADALTAKADAKEAPPTSTPAVTSPLSDIPSSNYGYSLLSQSEKVVYSQLLDGFDSMSSEIVITPTPVDTLRKIYTYVIDDNPELFWVDNSSYTYYYYNGQANKIVQPYLISAAQKSSMVSAVESKANAVLSRLSGASDDFSKVLIIHESLADSVTYNASTPMMHNLYGALVEGNAVCDGYSRAFQYLCKKAGIRALIVEGTAQSGGTSGGHAWNLIRMGSNYYHVDLTWDDPDSASLPGYVSYSYFGLTTKEISADHAIDQSIGYPIPTATATQYNYFVKEGLVFSTYDAAKDALESKIREADASKENYIEMKFTTDDGYSGADRNIQNDAYRTITAINASLPNRVTKIAVAFDSGAKTAILALTYS